jgi:hypothetical protein
MPRASGPWQWEFPYGAAGGIIPVMGMKKQRRMATLTMDDYRGSRYASEPLRLLEFGDWVDGGKTIGPGGSLPRNTSGGQLAEGRLHGLGFLAEGVAQLREDCGKRQVPDAQVAVVANRFGPQCGSVVLTV